MVFARLFRRRGKKASNGKDQKQEDIPKVPVDEAVTTTTTPPAASADTATPAPQPKNDAIPEPEEQQPSKFQYVPPDLSSDPIQTVFTWCQGFANNDAVVMNSIVVPSGDFIIHNAESEPLYMMNRDVVNVTLAWWKSFPGGSIGWERIEAIGENQAKVYGYHWFGHHTGVPFEFEPYPAIEPKGTFVSDGPIDILFTVKDGKILKAESFGANSGPHGTYEKLGGFLFS